MDPNSDLNLIQLLRDHGLQVTYQRLAIYSALLDSPHQSTEEIHQKVKTRFSMISLGTVYKSLEKFHEVGLVEKITLTDVARYQTKTDSHHHLFCVKCQTIRDIDDPIGEGKLMIPQGHGFKILGCEITVKGYCSKCAEKS